MPFVGPDRFDDVEYTLLKQPEPPRRWRPQRWLLAPLASVLIIGSLAAGASAVTAGDSAPALAPKGEAAKPDYRDFRDCDRRKHDGERGSSELRY
jgi:hypothetical protein